MKRIAITTVVAIGLLSGQASAQTATMDPAVIEEAAASSSQSLMVPILLALILVAIATQSDSAVVGEIIKIGPVS